MVRNMSYAELTEAIPYEAEQHLPFNLDDIELDFIVVGENHTDTEMLLSRPDAHTARLLW